MAAIKPCPFCGSTELDWTIPPYSRRVIPNCEDCGATGPGEYLPRAVDRNDRDLAAATAIRAWNSRAYVEAR